jgi:hypothetical protein
MAKKKSRPESKPEVPPDRHLSKTMVRLPVDVHAQLKKLAERNHRPLSWELRMVLIKHLEENGLWPPEPEA